MPRGGMKLAAVVGLARQVRQYARRNPESVSATIARVEAGVGRTVGPKYAAHVGRGGNAVRSGLGIPVAATGGGVGPDGATPSSAR